jgi:hypothetical protein
MMCLAVFENMWFRQLIDLYRLAGMYDIARRKHGWGRCAAPASSRQTLSG